MTDGDPRDKWTVWDPERENAHHFDARADAEDRIETAQEEFGVDADLYPPGKLPDALEDVEAPTTDGGQQSVEVVDAEAIDQESVDLPERTVAEDPLEWVPGSFVDEIDGAQAINRKGFEVLSHFYDVDVETDVEIGPTETDFEYCQVKATATTEDGRHCEAYGSAHVDRDDEAHLLLEMADTRARKRALSIATGVGAVAVEELKNEVTE